MTVQDRERPARDPVESNTRRSDRLIHEVEKLVALLEEQRLVEPTALVQLKHELHELERDR